MRINKKLFEIKDVKFRKKFSSKIPLLLEKDSRVGIIKIGRVERFEALEPEKKKECSTFRAMTLLGNGYSYLFFNGWASKKFGNYTQPTTNLQLTRVRIQR